MAAKRNSEAIAAGKVELYRSLIDALPFEDNTFDKILSIRTIALWSSKSASLQEIARVLKPDGTVALSFSPEALPELSNDEIITKMKSAGFKNIHLEKRDKHLCLLAEV